jgi:hypothetical protein
MGRSSVSISDVHQLLCLLVEQEVTRLNIWDKPMMGDADPFRDKKVY